MCWRVYRLLPSLRFEPLPCFLISTSSCIQWQQQGNQNELLLNSRSMSRSDQQLSARSIKRTLNRSSSYTSGAPRGKNTTRRCKTATSSVKRGAEGLTVFPSSSFLLRASSTAFLSLWFLNNPPHGEGTEHAG